MPVEKKGKKGSSPNVYKYFKVDGDKVTRIKKFVQDAEKEYTCQSIKTDTHAESVD